MGRRRAGRQAEGAGDVDEGVKSEQSERSFPCIISIIVNHHHQRRLSSEQTARPWETLGCGPPPLVRNCLTPTHTHAHSNDDHNGDESFSDLI